MATEKLPDSTTESLTALLSATLAFNAALVAMLRAIESADPDPAESAVDCAIEINVDWLMFWLLATDVLSESVIASLNALLFAVDPIVPADAAALRADESTVVALGAFAIWMPSFLRAVAAFSTRNVSPLMTMTQAFFFSIL